MDIGTQSKISAVLVAVFAFAVYFFEYIQANMPGIQAMLAQVPADQKILGYVIVGIAVLGSAIWNYQSSKKLEQEVEEAYYAGLNEPLVTKNQSSTPRQGKFIENEDGTQSFVENKQLGKKR